jgi:hypothetical protein
MKQFLSKSTILSARDKGTLKWGNRQIQKREECDSLGLGQNLVANVTQTYRTELLHAHWIGSFGMKTNSVSASLERQQPDSKASFNHMKQRITNKMPVLLIEKNVGSHQVLDVGGRNHLWWLRNTRRDKTSSFISKTQSYIYRKKLSNSHPLFISSVSLFIFHTQIHEHTYENLNFQPHCNSMQ